MISSLGSSNPFEGLGLRTQEEDQRASRGDDSLGQEQFLKLMIAQFQNQDPFEPMENGEFLGQLAQFGTVSGINELKDSFGELSGAMQSSQALQASTLVGSGVMAEGNRGFLTPGEGLQGAVKLDSTANDVVVDVLDVNGNRVRRMHLGTNAEGLARFDWDGLNDQGELMAPGEYRIEADVLRGGGTETGQVLLKQYVDSVTLNRTGKGVTLNTAIGGLSLRDVHEFL